MLLRSKFELVLVQYTGPTYRPCAMNIPSITLFGPTPGYRNTYKTRINKIIESDSTVDPKKIDKNDKSILSIEVQDILRLIDELL